MSYIICKDVAFAYENQIVVSGLSFQVDAGDYLCIIGENGTGKTTLMKGLLGLKKPYRGTIVTGDGLKSAEIGYVPQQDAVQRDFPASVYEVVLSGCLNSRGMKPGFGAEEKKRALGNMELLNISGLKNKSFQDLSGGQRQRVLLARSLCATKRLLLLDEPVTGLDPVAAEEFYGVLDALNGKHGDYSHHDFPRDPGKLWSMRTISCICPMGDIISEPHRIMRRAVWEKNFWEV